MFGFDLPAKAYKIVAELGVVLALLIASFFYGHHEGSLAGDAKIAALEVKHQAQLTDLLGLQNITNTRIVTQVVTKTQVIHDKQNTVNSLIPLVVDKQPLSIGWVGLYNASATDSAIDSATAANGATGGLTAAQALPTITDNNTLCRAQAVELKGLQDAVTAYNANIAAVNKKAHK